MVEQAQNQYPDRDDREPSEERKAELEAAYLQNIAQKKKWPYAQVHIQTYGELLWIFAQRGWSVDLYLREGKARPSLWGADLSGAQMKEANLRGAQLQEANLRGAQLQGANLIFAFLQGADLNDVQLEGANLMGAELNDANLRYAVMNSQTILDDVELNSGTQMGDIKWNGVYLTRIKWNHMFRLGDEKGIVKAFDREERIEAYRDAARAYRGLRIELKNQGLLLPASRFRLREQQMERRALRAERNVPSWFGSWLLDVVAGYGERPARIFISYVVVVLAFAAAYLGVTHFVETGLSHLSWDEALVLSLTSFHGRGFFPGFLSLGDWVSRLAAAEAVIGLFIELMLIATFSRRFLGD